MVLFQPPLVAHDLYLFPLPPSSTHARDIICCRWVSLGSSFFGQNRKRGSFSLVLIYEIEGSLRKEGASCPIKGEWPWNSAKKSSSNGKQETMATTEIYFFETFFREEIEGLVLNVPWNVLEVGGSGVTHLAIFLGRASPQKKVGQKREPPRLLESLLFLWEMMLCPMAKDCLSCLCGEEEYFPASVPHMWNSFFSTVLVCA